MALGSSLAARTVAQPSSPRPQASQTGEAGHYLPTACRGTAPMDAEQTQLGVCRPRLPGSPSAHPAPGLPLSGLGLWAFCSCRRRWMKTCVYMANPAATNFLWLMSPPRVLPILGQELGDFEGPLCGVPRGFYHVNPYRSTDLPVAIPRTATPPPALPAGSGLVQPPLGRLHWPGLWLPVSGTMALVVSLPPADENFHFGQGYTRAIKTFAFSLPWVSISLLTLSLSSTGTAPGGDHIPRALHIMAVNLATFVLCVLPVHVALVAELAAKQASAACTTIQHVADLCGGPPAWP